MVDTLEDDHVVGGFVLTIIDFGSDVFLDLVGLVLSFLHAELPVLENRLDVRNAF